jgi:hypothetical protein
MVQYAIGPTGAEPVETRTAELPEAVTLAQLTTRLTSETQEVKARHELLASLSQLAVKVP